jgi:hypothetical protein
VDNDEIIKVVLSTPLILDISSKKFYDSLFMSVQMKWHNEITRFLKIEINVPKEIILHEYCQIHLKVKNISLQSMDLVLEIADQNSEFSNQPLQLNTEVFDYKGKGIDEIPAVLSETKSKNVGVINPNEEKIIELRFLPLKNGFNVLPPFGITDKNSMKKFYIVHTNKIYVTD